jgi:hypothetical protein
MVIETNNEPEDRYNKPAKSCTSWECFSKGHQYDSKLPDHGVASQDKDGQNKTDMGKCFSGYV